MNQFLVGLVERATLRAPVLERRPRSLFEPMAPAAAGPATIDDAEPAERDDLDGGMDPAQRDDSSSPPRREPATGGDPDARSNPIERSPAADTPHRRGSLASSPAAPASSRARHASDERLEPSTAALHGELEPVARLETPLATARGVLSPPPEGEHSPLLARVSARAYLTGRAADAAHGPPRAHSAQPTTADSPAAAPAPTTTGEPLARTNLPLLWSGPRVPGPPALMVRSQAGPRALPPDGIVAPPPPAPVHVTIGRIEVRASTPAADRPPVRRAPAGPKLSLDDYLNGRRGGSR